MATNPTGQAEQPVTPVPSGTGGRTKGTAEGSGDLISKIFPPLAVVMVTAIFYYTGWVYIAHWYSFYGIDATQVNIPLQLILLHGFPGVVVLAISGSLALFLFSAAKKYIFKTEFSIADLPYAIIAAYLLSLIGIFIIIASLNFEIKIPTEVLIASFGLGILLIAFATISQIRSFLELSRFPIPSIPVGGLMTLSPAKVNVVYSMVVRALLQKKWKRVLDILFHRTEEIRIEISREEAELKRLAKEQSDRIVEIIKESWRFWVIAIVLFYFFISIASSALIGEWDALRGGRFMVGDWHIPEVSLYSTSSIPALKNYEITLGNGFEYKPLGLLANDEKNYYLVDWKTTEYYTNKPQVYVVPRSDDLILNLIVSPFGYQTPTPTVTSTPSLTPAAATPTP